jgi:beta-glucan synthesis-associated protein KRE6
MSSNSNSSSSPPRIPPHIRLNSAQEDLLLHENNRQPTSGASRSLIPPVGALRHHPSQGQVYDAPSVQDSQERLLPPHRSKSHRLREDDSPVKSPERSGFSSRRTSWSSERSRDSRGFENPFSDSRGASRAGSRADSDDENVNTQTVSEKYNILPSAGLLLFPEDIEKDDYLHNPDPSGKEDRDCDVFTRRGITNVGGLALITIGLLVLFIGYPVL